MHLTDAIHQFRAVLDATFPDHRWHVDAVRHPAGSLEMVLHHALAPGPFSLMFRPTDRTPARFDSAWLREAHDAFWDGFATGGVDAC